MIPQAGRIHTEIDIFPKGNGVGTAFTEFSGLRMRDGTPAQPCTSGTYGSWSARGSRGAAGAGKCTFFGRQLDRGEEDDIANLVSQTGTLGGSLHIPAPTAFTGVGSTTYLTWSHKQDTQGGSLHIRSHRHAKTMRNSAFS